MPDYLLEQLLDLIVRIYSETDGFLEQPDDQQRWYDRGYANGMVKALDELGYAGEVAQRITPDASDFIQPQLVMDWGKAYSHGLDVGHRETYEINQQQNA